MIKGYIDKITPLSRDYIRIHGWALQTEFPDVQEMVEIYCDGVLKVRALGNQHREDLKPIYQSSGNHAFTVDVQRPMYELTIKVIDECLKFSNQAQEFLNGLRAYPEAIALAPTPLLISSFGRSGSTALMNMLGSSIDISFIKEYPYERRFLIYFLHMAGILMKPYNQSEIWNHKVLMQGDIDYLGPIPYELINEFDHNLRFAQDVLLNTWNRFIDEQPFQHKPYPIYWAEKGQEHIVLFERLGIRYWKMILLIRDPRDHVVSTRKFNEKRGWHDFGWEPGFTDMDYARKMLPEYKIWLMRAINCNNDQCNLLIKYEDMIRDLINTSKKIAEWLNIDIDPSNITRHDAHITSNSVEESVDRWKKELSKDVQDYICDNLHEEMRLLHYV